MKENILQVVESLREDAIIAMAALSKQVWFWRNLVTFSISIWQLLPTAETQISGDEIYKLSHHFQKNKKIYQF
jgi:hypothetical protein